MSDNNNNNNVLSPKYAEESILISFNFINILVPNEAITSATFSSIVKTGTDTADSSMIIGTADFTADPIVRQQVAAGIKSNTYSLKCVITTANRTLAHEEILTIR